ncbi:unnamed protein product [Didymodactylos carnosus]|uniref:Uncharacterized protein n=1 Tax=Didymodactylos carnosus TaxID=1234261 RepID=A0A814XD93_9BILA|nr:unnamed protein product [Didymodactylos carnosus]CAF3980102.1 unnamed protein product [Didymodactylos carnosus]
MARTNIRFVTSILIYGGCFTQVSKDTYFQSSLMTPELCFQLCDTPLVYLQNTVCRCRGAALGFAWTPAGQQAFTCTFTSFIISTTNGNE